MASSAQSAHFCCATFLPNQQLVDDSRISAMDRKSVTEAAHTLCVLSCHGNGHAHLPPAAPAPGWCIGSSGCLNTADTKMGSPPPIRLFSSTFENCVDINKHVFYDENKTSKYVYMSVETSLDASKY